LLQGQKTALAKGQQQLLLWNSRLLAVLQIDRKTLTVALPLPFSCSHIRGLGFLRMC